MKKIMMLLLSLTLLMALAGCGAKAQEPSVVGSWTIDEERTEQGLQDYGSLQDLFGSGYAYGSRMDIYDNGTMEHVIGIMPDAGIGPYIEDEDTLFYLSAYDAEDKIAFEKQRIGGELYLTERFDGETIYWMRVESGR